LLVPAPVFTGVTRRDDARIPAFAGMTFVVDFRPFMKLSHMTVPHSFSL